MNWKFFISSLFISLLVPFAKGQTTAPQSLESDSRVVAARCRYSPLDSACVEVAHTSPPVSQTPSVKAAQCHRRCPWPPRRGYPQAPRPSSPPYLFQPEYGTHAGAGAMIGFLVGAGAAASAATDGRSRFVAGVFGGGFGALVGAVIGHGIPSSHWPHRHHYPDPDDDEEEMAVTRPPKMTNLKEP